jgi:hypothetical protein
MPLSWNGQYYRHFVFESRQNSRRRPRKTVELVECLCVESVLTDAQSDAILDTYISRRRPDAFARDGYSIDPPFLPAPLVSVGGRVKPGSYVNGGIMPLVGGGCSPRRLSDGDGRRMALRPSIIIGGHAEPRAELFVDGPEGSEGVGTPDTISTDGWGTAAMLAAYIEGAVGVVDQGVICIV